MFQYVTNCVGSDADSIMDMTEAATQVTYDTLVKHVGRAQLESVFPFYTWHGRGGLTLKKDWAVSYWKSTYRGRPCYYVDHSCIEYVFCE